MNLAEALVALASPVRRPGADEALQTVGAHLASLLEPAPRAVAVAVGKEGVMLHRGAAGTLHRPDGEAVPVHAAALFTEDWSHATTFRWVNAPPPTNAPIVVWVPYLVTGAVVRTLLAQCPRTEPEVPVTIAAIDAQELAYVELMVDHPGIEVITAVRRTGAHP